MPGPGGLPADALPADVEAAVTATMRAGRIAGLSLAVVDRDGLRYAAGFGEADLALGTPAAPDTGYLWFSMTKVVTATATLRLADEGLLDLDAPAAEYVEALCRPGLPRPSVRRLLGHTSGLANPLPIRWVHPAAGPGPEPAAMLDRLLRRRHAFRSAPGERERYSNVGYLALGEVIGAVAGTPYPEYVQRAVLDPLRMTGTGFRPAPGVPAATGYAELPRIADPLLRLVLPHGVVGRRVGDRLALRPFLVDGAAYGGLVGDVLDAGRFLRLHLTDGDADGIRVLAPGTAERMRRIGPGAGHGLGWSRGPGEGRQRSVQHLGGGMGFWNLIRLYPDLGLGVAVMTNGTRQQDFEPILAAVRAAAGRAAAGRGSDRPVLRGARG